MTSVPPPAAPEGTQPCWGGWPRSTLWDPMQLAAKFCSSGWKKDLEHVLRVYYKFSIASFKEAEWTKLKEKFFEYFFPLKEEAVGLKERCPLDFMAYVEDHFYKAMGLHLNGLRSFTGWIKQGSYYHRLVVQQGRLQECPHLVGVPLPRWPQVTPSESCLESQMKVDTQTPSSSRPSVGATAAPSAETPVTEAPAEETLGAAAPVAPSGTPAPMETGRAGDGQSWAEQVEAGEDEAFQRSRPMKCTWSQSRRCEPRLPLPFPLQDKEGRHAAIAQLYDHAAEQPAAHHNVASRGIMHLHLDMLPQKAMCLGNQVACMIAEYHLTASARGQSSLPPIIPQEAAPLLPPLKSYVLGVAFKGTRDVRVVDRAMAFQVAVWLHHLDMAIEGKGLASETLQASRHHLGLLLESFLVPRMSNLTFQEVVDHVLDENCRSSQHLLHYLRGCHAHDHEVLEGLIRAHRELGKADKDARKSLMKEMDERRKSLEMLKERISYYEAQLGLEPSEGYAPDEDGQFSQGVQAEMAPALGPDEAPSESAATPASEPPPAEGQTQDMEADDDGVRPHLPSPVSCEDDNFLMGNEAMGVESDLAHLSVLSPRDPDGEGEEASGYEALPL